MASVTVRNLGEAMIVVARLLNEMRTRGSVGDLVSRTRQEVERAQLAAWDAGLGVHARSTVLARAARDQETYYGQVSPNGRARPASPYLEWSGALRAAASRLTSLQGSRAIIDADRSYRGPIRGSRPFTEAVLRRVSEDRIWPVREIERRVEGAVLEPWAERVASIVARRPI